MFVRARVTTTSLLQHGMVREVGSPRFERIPFCLGTQVLLQFTLMRKLLRCVMGWLRATLISEPAERASFVPEAVNWVVVGNQCKFSFYKKSS